MTALLLYERVEKAKGQDADITRRVESDSHAFEEERAKAGLAPILNPANTSHSLRIAKNT